MIAMHAGKQNHIDLAEPRILGPGHGKARVEQKTGPSGSSNSMARSRRQNSPSWLPIPVILTVCAPAGAAVTAIKAAAAIAVNEIDSFLIPISPNSDFMISYVYNETVCHCDSKNAHVY